MDWPLSPTTNLETWAPIVHNSSDRHHTWCGWAPNGVQRDDMFVFFTSFVLCLVFISLLKGLRRGDPSGEITFLQNRESVRGTSAGFRGTLMLKSAPLVLEQGADEEIISYSRGNFGWWPWEKGFRDFFFPLSLKVWVGVLGQSLLLGAVLLLFVLAEMRGGGTRTSSIMRVETNKVLK